MDERRWAEGLGLSEVRVVGGVGRGRRSLGSVLGSVSILTLRGPRVRLYLRCAGGIRMGELLVAVDLWAKAPLMVGIDAAVHMSARRRMHDCSPAVAAGCGSTEVS